MSAAIDRGRPFELDDSWRPAKYELRQNEHTHLFSSPDYTLPLLEVENNDDRLISTTELELGGIDVVRRSPSLSKVTPSLPSGDGGHRIRDAENPQPRGSLPDIWNVDPELAPGPHPFTVHSWEAFQENSVARVERPIYLSEANAGAIDAAFSRLTHCHGVLPRDTSLRALSNLALGRSSVLFHWRAEKMEFEQSLEQVPISGMSVACSSSLVSWMMQYGTKLRTLQDWIDSQNAGDCTLASVTALKKAAARMLQALEATVALSVSGLASLLQLQDILHRPFELLVCIETMRAAVTNCFTEEQATSALSLCVQSSADSGSELTGAMRELLALACAPWLDSLAINLGLSASTDWECSDSTLCLAAALDQEGELSSTNDGSGTKSSDLLLSKEDHELVKETRASLKLLRKYLPDHMILQPIDGSPATRVSSRAGGPQNAETSSVNPWAIAQQDRLTEMSAQMLLAPLAPAAATNDDLHAATLHFLQSDWLARKPANDIDLLPVLHINPFDKIRPQIEAQSRHLNQLFIRHLFQICDLRKHLELQHMFHLFGDGEFVRRLSTALFSLETQSAHRTGGKVPTGQPIGLQLGAEGMERWPPASSELRLTLNGLLNESYHRNIAYDDTLESSRADILRGFSFSIRELDDKDIERVMDSSSIYALDFLKLEYAVPAPLDVVLTPASMEKYDGIFRFVLRILRVLDATTRLQSSTLAEQPGFHLGARRITLQLHRFMTSLTACFFDIAIEVPWKQLRGAISSIERGLSRPESGHGLIGIVTLRGLHDECLERIRSRLFLKHKQEKLRNALESLLVAVLAGAGALHAKNKTLVTETSLIAAFETAVKAFLNLLQNMVDGPQKHRTGRPNDDEMEMVTILLAQLNFNRFYDER